jgi:hypothetical protein
MYNNRGGYSNNLTGSGSYSSNPASSSSETAATRHAGHGNYPSYNSGHASNSTINYSGHNYYNNTANTGTSSGGMAGGTAGGDEHGGIVTKAQWCSWCNTNWTAYQDSIRAIWAKTKARCLVPMSQAFLASVYWRVFLLFGNFVLLFGSPIQMLLTPPAADPFFDVLYTVVLVAFLVDMIFRAAAVPGYFGIHFHTFFRKQRQSSSSQRHHHQRNSNSSSFAGGGTRTTIMSFLCGCLCCCWCFVSKYSLCWPTMGSFLFWCDLASTLTLFYDISFTNPANFEMEKINLDFTGATGVRM